MRSFTLTLTLCLVVGCSTTLTVHDISSVVDGKDDTLPNTFATLEESQRGIPFRVLEPRTVRLYKRQPDGTYSPIGKPVRSKLPSMDTLYSLNYRSGQFSNHTFELKLNADGTITSVGATESKQLDEALATIETEASAVATAIIDRDVTEKTREKADLELETGLMGAHLLLIEAEDKLRTAEEARAALDDSEDDE